SDFYSGTAITPIYTLSLHDALPIYQKYVEGVAHEVGRTELQGVADLAVLAETAALQVDVSVEFPVALARPRALVERVPVRRQARSEEHTSELQSRENLVCRLLLEKK